MSEEIINISLEELDKQIKALAYQRNQILEKSLSSKDLYDIEKAQQYLQSIEKRQDTGMKSFVFSPDHEFYNSLGYKNHPTNVSYNTLRNMARTPVIRAIIKTRLDQIANFSELVEDEQQKGWTIRKKRKLFETEADKKLTKQDHRIIQDISDFIINGGINANTWGGDNFETFLRKFYKDSLEMDQGTFEIVHNRRGLPVEYMAVDGATMRLAETYDDRDTTARRSNEVAINGYFPSYVQVWESQVYNEYYPWEMCFGVRNQSTNIMNNGYGISELEDMIQVVTYLLYSFQYNGNFFRQGSNPKGILNIKNGAASNALNELKQVWRSTIAGVQNAHRLPVVEGVDLEWINMQQTNKEMEFQMWNDFLMMLACAMYTIDPTEIGFNLQKAATMFGQDGQKQRLEHSQTKGLVPLLKFGQRKMTKYIVERLNPNYEFIFCGIEQEDKVVALEQDVKKAAAGFVSLEDMFKKYSGRDLDTNKDTILNAIYLQLQNMKMMGGQESNDAVDQMTGEQNNNENPFMKGLEDWTEKNIINKTYTNE